MTARINTTVYHVPVSFDGTEGVAGRAEIVETSPPGARERTCEMTLSGLPETIADKADAALANGEPVDVRTLGFFGPWTVVEPIVDEGGKGFRLLSAGYIMAAMPSVGRI